MAGAHEAIDVSEERQNAVSTLLAEFMVKLEELEPGAVHLFLVGVPSNDPRLATLTQSNVADLEMLRGWACAAIDGLKEPGSAMS